MKTYSASQRASLNKSIESAMDTWKTVSMWAACQLDSVGCATLVRGTGLPLGVEVIERISTATSMPIGG